MAPSVDTHAATQPNITKEKAIKDVASNDSAAESLDTLTADLSKNKTKNSGSV